MYLKKWNPIVSPGRGGILCALRFEFKLECLFCKNQYEYTTGGHGIMTDDLPQSIKWEIDDISKLRTCDSCGIVSGVPKLDRIRIHDEAAQLITVDWARDAIDQCQTSLRTSRL